MGDCNSIHANEKTECDLTAEYERMSFWWADKISNTIRGPKVDSEKMEKMYQDGEGSAEVTRKQERDRLVQEILLPLKIEEKMTFLENTFLK